MNREIKFRAKDKKDGIWYTGYYFNDTVKDYLLVGDFKIEIDINTLGELTTTKGIDGEEIWEGDIVKMNDEICVVIFDQKSSSFVGYKNAVTLYSLDRSYFSIKVIGNKYDNLELLNC